jgi:hypothetical protein
VSLAPMALIDSAPASPIKAIRADCDSQHEKEINSHFLLMSAILAAQPRRWVKIARHPLPIDPIDTILNSDTIYL